MYVFLPAQNGGRIFLRLRNALMILEQNESIRKIAENEGLVAKSF